MSHPDFELYDNIGRDAEQIAAAHFGIATRSDLLRWARRDAEPFLTEHPLPEKPLPTPDLAPYLAALTAAETPAEAHAVTNHLLDAAEPALRAVSDYLFAAAQWRGQNREAAKGSPSNLLMEAANRSLGALAIADQADLAVLRAEYDPVPTHPTPGSPRDATGLPPRAPNTSPAGPTSSR